MPQTKPSNKPLDDIACRKRIPCATYRLQFNRDFTFEQALGIVDYLRDLGITDIYASPIFQAGPESTHGYDICCYELISPHIGGREGLDKLTSSLRESGMGLILDMVPNHMGSDGANRWWCDVLEKGRQSSVASWFDIDWQALSDKVLLPVLEDHYSKVLESGKLRLTFDQDSFFITYYNKHFPLAMESYAPLLKDVLTLWPGKDSAIEAIENLKTRIQELSSSKKRSATHRLEFEKVKEQLGQWHATSEGFRKSLQLALRLYQGEAGNPSTFDKLHALLQAQHFRLAWWKVGASEINYRRFFDVTELVSLRMELSEVFCASHALVFQLLSEGKITGLRIDHPDGLWDPREYFQRLQEHFLICQLGKARGKKGEVLHGTPEIPLYVVAEKILSGDEALPSNWLVDGTTGYDFLNRLNGIFVQQQYREEFKQIYSRFGGDLDFQELVYASKKRMLEKSLTSELNALANRLKQVALATRYGLDFTYAQLRDGLAEVIAAFPVYRTYLTPGLDGPSAIDQKYIDQAIQQAKSRNAKFDASVFEFLQRLLLRDFADDFDEPTCQRAWAFIMKFQQLSGPVMAKGLEDTAFYNYNCLVSLNDVGGNPETFGESVEAFHRFNVNHALQWPHSLLATATHDTKRGEDVRARINVLSEMPAEWERAVESWREINAPKKTLVDGEPAPHPNEEYLLYQTLVGAWPDDATSPDTKAFVKFRDRFDAYMQKVIKESKKHTSWTEPNVDYEQATRLFIHGLFEQSLGNTFFQEFVPFQRRVKYFGIFNGLSQILLKMTSPGVPDFYQGSELWDLTLVDPDNRRPVDYGLRRRHLSELLQQMPEKREDWPLFLERLLKGPDTGKVKLYVILRALHFRRDRREVFDSGGYLPILVHGGKRGHLAAFARDWAGRTALVVASRLVFTLLDGQERLPVGADVWGDTWIAVPQAHPGDQFRNALTQEVVTVANLDGTPGLAVGDILSSFPVGLLEPVNMGTSPANFTGLYPR